MFLSSVEINEGRQEDFRGARYHDRPEKKKLMLMLMLLSLLFLLFELFFSRQRLTRSFHTQKCSKILSQRDAVVVVIVVVVIVVVVAVVVVVVVRTLLLPPMVDEVVSYAKAFENLEST